MPANRSLGLLALLTACATVQDVPDVPPLKSPAYHPICAEPVNVPPGDPALKPYRDPGDSEEDAAVDRAVERKNNCDEGEGS
jgi:hypothetical protein